MSSNKRKRTAPKTRNVMVRDVTIYDSANSTVPVGRVKKSTPDLLTEAQKNFKNENALKNNWEASLLPDDELESKRRQRSNSTKLNPDVVRNESGRTYPVDLWFILAEYIKPEDFLKFSLICKDAYHAANTVTFWSRLYKRYYKRQCPLPDHLKPTCLQNRHGLKTHVVKALYHFYPPFMERVPDSRNLMSLIRMRCLTRSLECNRERGTWVFKFVLCKPDYWCAQPRRRDECDINANPELGCKTLVVVSDEYRFVPWLCGMRLVRLRPVYSHSLSMVFSASPLSDATEDPGEVFVNIRICAPVMVFNWWEPVPPNL